MVLKLKGVMVLAAIAVMAALFACSVTVESGIEGHYEPVEHHGTAAPTPTPTPDSNVG